MHFGDLSSEVEGVTHLPCTKLLLRALLLTSVLAVAPACTGEGKISAQPPKRVGTPAQILDADTAFVSAVQSVSRNPSAFFQEAKVVRNCEFELTANYAAGADSVRDVHRFDAGKLGTESRMSMSSGGGVILFTYPTVEGASSVTRERLTVSGGTVSSPRTDSLGEIVVLIAETSGQGDVRRLSSAWTNVVRLCGGRVNE